jgi:soluble lytic murein transglycosylase-like protein
MALDKPFTVRDHLEPRLSAAAGSRVGTAARRRFGSFEQILKAEKTEGSAPAASAGLKISEYLKRPLENLQTVRTSKAVIEAALLPVAQPPSAQAAATTVAAGKTTVEAQPLRQTSRSRSGRSNATGEASPTGAVEGAIRQAAAKYNLSADLIRSVIRAESNFQPTAVSSAGAMGLMQLMPDTARDLGVTNAFDVRQNVDGGARYLRQMLDRFNGDLKLALQAYNAGPGAVEQYKGDVPFTETRQYVKRVLGYAGVKA